MNSSVIVYGPPGCGKTANAQKLRDYFGLSQVIDGFDPSTDFIPDSGALVLTNQRPQGKLRKQYSVFEFSNVMKDVENVYPETGQTKARITVGMLIGLLDGMPPDTEIVFTAHDDFFDFKDITLRSLGFERKPYQANLTMKSAVIIGLKEGDEPSEDQV